MLVITRSRDEEICIGAPPLIIIRVASIRNDKVRLVVDAPRELSVHRREMYNEIHGKQLQAEVQVAHFAPYMGKDEVLDQLVQNWVLLPEHIKLAIQALVDTA